MPQNQGKSGPFRPGLGGRMFAFFPKAAVQNRRFRLGPNVRFRPEADIREMLGLLSHDNADLLTNLKAHEVFADDERSFVRRSRHLYQLLVADIGYYHVGVDR